MRPHPTVPTMPHTGQGCPTLVLHGWLVLLHAIAWVNIGGRGTWTKIDTRRMANLGLFVGFDLWWQSIFIYWHVTILPVSCHTFRNRSKNKEGSSILPPIKPNKLKRDDCMIEHMAPVQVCCRSLKSAVRPTSHVWEWAKSISKLKVQRWRCSQVSTCVRD